LQKKLQWWKLKISGGKKPEYNTLPALLLSTGDFLEQIIINI